MLYSGVGIPDERSAADTGALDTPASLLARRLLARGGLEEAATPADVGIALQRTCARVNQQLCDSMGDEGCAALLARALARTEVAHPALKTLRRTTDDTIDLDGVVASVEANGAAAVTAAVEALLAALMDVLTRLIGEDMAIRIIDADAPSRSNGTTP